MKTTRLSILPVILLLFFFENSLAQQLHTITLYVNTSALSHQRDVNQNANFGQEAGISNEDYTVLVNLNDDVEWVGASSSAPGIDSVLITKIKYAKKTKLLNSDDIDGVNTIRAKVDKGQSGDEEKYELHFKFMSSGNPQNQTFKIDPVLKIQ